MTTLTPPMPATRTPVPVVTRPTVPFPSPSISVDDIFRLSVEQYHVLVNHDALTTDDRIELLEGLLVRKMSKKPPHSSATSALMKLLKRIVNDEVWSLRPQDPVTLDTSEPEPDVVVAKGTDGEFKKRHPIPSQIELIVEIAETSLGRDEGIKLKMYARNGIREYWIANLIEGRVQVYSDPTGSADGPTYRDRRDYGPGTKIPLTLDGQLVGTVDVDGIMA